MNRIDIPTADFHYQDENFKLSLWLRIQLPKPLFNPRRPAQPRIEVTFSNMNLSILCPQSIEGEAMAIRAMYLSYDHLSDLCSSYEKPAVPQEYQHDLEQYTSSYWRAMLKYKYDHRVRAVKKPPEEGQENATGEGEQQQEEEQEEEEKELGPDDEIPTVPWQKLTPSASEYVLYEEDTQFLRTRQSLLTTVPAGVINLRRFLVLGGVYYVNLLFQPPQPQDFVTLDMQITPLYLPKQLEEVPFYVEYQPPAPPEPGVRRQPEEIEEEMKKQEEEFDKQILITLTIPEHVIFLELPLVCRWDKERICWTQDDVHDVKHNEEKGYLTFRTCRFGIYTLATNRYSNFPYQAWEIKPEADNTVSFQITAAILMLEFNVKNGLVALTQLQNSPNNAMQDIVGTYMKLPRLIKIMQTSGVDVFPAFDAFCYIEGTCEKHWPTEKHLYSNMAALSNTFNFSWSRWNHPAGRRKIVFQTREYFPDKSKQKNFSMILVTPQNAQLIECTEVSATFIEEPIEGSKFCADLYNLMKVTSSIATRNRVTQNPLELIYALSQLLIATRVLSFS